MFEMTMKLDQDVLSALRLSPDEFANEMRLAAATHWYNVTRFLRKKQPKLLDRTVPISSCTSPRMRRCLCCGLR
jgi:hypothetical protein